GSLQENIQQLPLIQLEELLVELLPAKNTEAAIRLGVSSALVGAVWLIVGMWAEEWPEPFLIITGGGHNLIPEGDTIPGVSGQSVVPTLTLEGIRIAAEALP